MTAAEAWVVRAGRDDEYAEAALERGIVGIGWSRVGDLGPVGTPREVRSLVAEAYPHEPAAVRTLYALQLHAFRTTIRPGHLVVLLRRHSPEVAVGEVTGDYRYVSGAAPAHVRAVRWLQPRMRRGQLGSDLLEVPALAAVSRVTREHDRQRVLDAAKGVTPSREPTVRPIGEAAAAEPPIVGLRRNLTFAKDLADAGSHLEALGVSSFEFGDVYRAAWLQAVSSLDHWISREIHDRTVALGQQPDPKAAFRSYTQPKKIRDGLRSVADVTDLWPRVAAVVGGGRTVTAADVVEQLQAASDRRNAIAHGCDEDPGNPPYKQDITVARTMEVIDFLEQTAEAILVVIDRG